jgi:hypothetical protein
LGGDDAEQPGDDQAAGLNHRPLHRFEALGNPLFEPFEALVAQVSRIAGILAGVRLL